MDAYQQAPVRFRPQHQSSQPLRALHDGQAVNASFQGPPAHNFRDSALNPAASNFVAQRLGYQTSALTPSGQTTPRARSQTSTIHPIEQLHRGQAQVIPLPTRDELDQEMSQIMSTYFNDPRSRLHALTILKTQVLGFVTAKSKKEAEINVQLERERREMDQSSYEAILVLDEEEKKRLEILDIYGRKFVELGEAINEAHEEIYFGSTADPLSGL